MKRLLHKSCLGAFLLLAAARVSAQTDITDQGGSIFAQHPNPDNGGNEDYFKLIDNSPTTKYYTPWPSLWVVYVAAYPSAVTSYAISSANDLPERDPKNWVLEGSNDGANWLPLDTRTNQDFTERWQRKVYTFSNTASYILYRIRVTENHGSWDTQFSEWELFTSQQPKAPSNLSATLLSGQKVSLTWADNSGTELNVILERSLDGKNYTTAGTFAPNTRKYTDTGLATNAQYAYRVRMLNGAGMSAPSPAVVIRTQNVSSLPDITDFTDGVISDPNNTTGNEGVAMLIDNDIETKFYTGQTGWVQYYLPGGANVKYYALTSGNDAPVRDPKEWKLEGSNDGVNWKQLDYRVNQAFPGRKKRLMYTVNNNNATYKYHRLQVIATGSYDFQLSELQLYGTGKGTLDKTKPAAPANFTASVSSPFQVILDWEDQAKNELRVHLERSTDSLHWTTEWDLPAGDTRFYSRDLKPNTRYFYRLRTENNNGKSAWVTTQGKTPADIVAPTWKEHWGQHDELLERMYYNNDVAIYFDEAVDRSATWLYEDFTRVWKYVKKNYGSFSDPRLYLVFHSVNKDYLSGGHPASPYDADHDYRNAVDMAGGWASRDSWTYGVTVHEIGHIVEGANKGVKESPAFGLWGDSKWCEIFNYDVYKNVGWMAEAAEVVAQMETQYDTYPRAGTQWFKNWFYPIYQRADSGVTLNRYFQLLSEYFPQHNGAYVGGLNMGEFIHFFSGAAGYNLKAQADTAFGWNEQYEIEFRQAQIDYPFTYPDERPYKPQPPKGRDDVKDYLLSIFPNPASGYVYLNGPDATVLYTVDVYNLAGVKVLTSRISGKNAPVNISPLQTGVYIFKVYDTRGTVFTRKVLVANLLNGHKW